MPLSNCCRFAHYAIWITIATTSSFLIPKDAVAQSTPSEIPTTSVGFTVREGSTIVLPIPPVMQQTVGWDWIAAAEMIFTYKRIPSVNSTSFQCGLVAWFGGPKSACWQDCRVCAALESSKQRIDSLYSHYPQFAVRHTETRISHMTFAEQNGFLDSAEVLDEINFGSPVEAIVDPIVDTQSKHDAHATLITGYAYAIDGSLLLTVNDPCPYEAYANEPNPYHFKDSFTKQKGTYIVRYSDFKRGLGWYASFYHFKAN